MRLLALTAGKWAQGRLQQKSNRKNNRGGEGKSAKNNSKNSKNIGK